MGERRTPSDNMKGYMVLIETDGDYSSKDIKRFVEDGLWKGNISRKNITVLKVGE